MLFSAGLNEAILLNLLWDLSFFIFSITNGLKKYKNPVLILVNNFVSYRSNLKVIIGDIVCS